MAHAILALYQRREIAEPSVEVTTVIRSALE